MKTTLKKLAYSGLTVLTIGVLAACSSTSSSSTSSSSSSATVTNTSNNSSTSSSTSSSVDWSSLPTTEVSLTNEGLTITEGGTYILTGTTTGGVTVETDANVRIILAGATISSSDTAAINVVSAGTVEIELQDGTENTVKDSSTHSNTDIEGAIHVEADLIISGNGSLTVEGNFQDGIVSTDNLTINAGNITVTAADDGIRGKDSLTINGGTIDVTATGDGIKATNDEDTTNITINGGTIDVYATDDSINAASTTSTDIFIKVTGGNLKVEVGSGDTDAFDSNGDIYISGGTIDITAPTSAFDFDGVAELTGGTVTVNGEQISEIVATGPGAGGGRGGW